MSAGILDITIEQGTTFELAMAIKNAEGTPTDLTGYEVRGSLRTTAISASVVADLTCTVTDESAGLVTVSLDDTETSAIPTSGSTYDEYTEYVYDIEMVSGSGIVSRLLNGKVFVSPEVTRGS